MDVGSTLDHYRIVDKLGEGGMGEVYRAEDTRLKRDVAIKVLPPALSDDAERLARMRREAQVLAALDHPNIASIYGLEEAGGVRFLVMQLAEGETLEDRLGSGPLPADESLRIALQIAEALEAAHQKGIVHRDLKPANVQLAADGKVTVLDFGLAKVYETELASTDGATDLSASPTLMQGTRAGMILGTAPYMSPEQARGTPVDARADIWAFGCVLYEMVTGQRAFPGDNVTDVLGGIVHKDPEWDAVPSRTPRRVMRLMSRCLTKDPNRRLQAVGDARIAIQEYFEDPAPKGRGSEAAPSRTPARERLLPWGVAALAVLALVWSLASSGSGAGEQAPGMHLDVQIAEHPLFAGLGASAVLSPDGRNVVYVEGFAGSQSILLRSLERPDSAIALAPLGYNPFFSPDGQWVGYATTTQLFKVAASGGAPVPLAAVNLSRGASWGPDETIVYAAAQTGGLSRVSSSGGGTPVPVTELDEARGEVTHRWPQHLPGGEWVIFTSHVRTTEFDDAAIEAVSLLDGTRKIIVQGGTYGRYVPSGHLVYANRDTVFAVPFDVDALETRGNPSPVIQSLSVDSTQGGAQYSFSRTGTLLYRAAGSGTPLHPAVWVDRDGRVSPLWREPRSQVEPRVSPDGNRLGVMILTNGNWDVWVYDSERDVATRLTFNESFDGPAIWSPDGQWILFTSDRNGLFNLYRKRADGSGEVEQITDFDVPVIANDWSPDGQHLLYIRGASSDIWTVSIDGGEGRPVVASPFGEAEATFSPDGRWVAYTSDETGQNEIYVIPFDSSGGRWQISDGGGNYPRWAGDGRELFYRNDLGVVGVEVGEAAGTFRAGRREQVFEGTFRGGSSGIGLGGYTFADWAPHPDGTRFVLFPDPDTSGSGTIELVKLVTRWFDQLEGISPTR